MTASCAANIIPFPIEPRRENDPFREYEALRPDGMPVRAGDKVTITKGIHKGKTAFIFGTGMRMGPQREKTYSASVDGLRTILRASDFEVTAS